MIEDAVAAAVRAAFGEERCYHILRLLETYGVETYERESERVRLALVKLSGGSEEKLAEHLAVAKVDYRDILLWADEPQTARLDDPEERRRAFDALKKLGLGAGVVIEHISEARAEGFRACLDAVARERRFLAQVEAPPLQRVRDFVRDSVKNDAAQFVAVDGGAVVGWCDVFPDWPETTKHCGTLGMGVLAAYRGQGIGSRLLAACLAKAKAGGITRITLKVRADNAAAIGLYERAGFRHEARLVKAMRFDGVYYDELQMSLIEP